MRIAAQAPCLRGPLNSDVKPAPLRSFALAPHETDGARRLEVAAPPNPIDMHYRNDRQVTHPWLGRQRTQSLELPPGAEAPVSAARLALEAAFDELLPSQALQSRTAADAPAVVVKRRRTLPAHAVPGRPGDASRDPHDAQANAVPEGERAPRVFRVDSAPVQKVIAPAPEPAADSWLGDSTDELWIEPVPLVAARRPRRRAAPAIVTTVVPESTKPTVRHVHANEADGLLARLAALEATFSVIRQAQSFTGIELPNRRRYTALVAQIELLRTVAEAARRVETAKAISRIKRDIKRYGLSRDDLGI